MPTPLVTLCTWIGLTGLAWGQPPSDCRPNALNIPGAPYPCVFPDNRVGTKTFSDQLTQAGIRNVSFESPGTAHEWLTWRRCLKEFAPRLSR